MSKALEIVQAFQMSLGSGTHEWQNLTADDISFKGPVDQVSGKEKFIELNKSFLHMVRGYAPLHSFGTDSNASLEGTFKVATPKGNEITLEMSEVYTINNGKIQSIRVYYDAEEFRKEMSS